MPVYSLFHSGHRELGSVDPGVASVHFYGMKASCPVSIIAIPSLSPTPHFERFYILLRDFWVGDVCIPRLAKPNCFSCSRVGIRRALYAASHRGKETMCPQVNKRNDATADTAVRSQNSTHTRRAYRSANVP